MLSRSIWPFCMAHKIWNMSISIACCTWSVTVCLLQGVEGVIPVGVLARRQGCVGAHNQVTCTRSTYAGTIVVGRGPMSVYSQFQQHDHGITESCQLGIVRTTRRS